MKRILILLVAFVALAPAASAQYSTRGVHVRPHLVGAGWRVHDFDFQSEAESGGGFGVGLGYGFTEVVAAYVEFSGTAIDSREGDTYGLAHVDLGASFTVGSPESRVKGNFLVALSGRGAVWDNVFGTEVTATGIGLSAGGGLLYFVSPKVALDMSLEWTYGRIDRVTVSNLTWDLVDDVYATSARLNLGVAWYPGW